MREWKEIYEFEDGNRAVCNGKGGLMLKQLPKFISVMPPRLEAEVCKWLFDKNNQCPHLMNILGKEAKQKIFIRLLNEEYRKEVQIVS